MHDTHEHHRAAIEDRVATIWREVLQQDAIAPGDHFFQLGGNSLAAVKFLAEIEERYGLEALTPEQLYETPRFDQIVSAIESHVRG